MIQPDKLRQFNTREIPYSVNIAWEKHQAFVSASSLAAHSVGVRFLEGVKPDTIALGFFRSMLENGGTDKDLDWLIANDVVEQAANSFWNVAVDEYATGGWS
jgi:hypothetical protein